MPRSSLRRSDIRQVRPSLFFSFLGRRRWQHRSAAVSREEREPRALVEDPDPKRRRLGWVFYFLEKQKTPKRHCFEASVFF